MDIRGVDDDKCDWLAVPSRGVFLQSAILCTAGGTFYVSLIPLVDEQKNAFSYDIAWWLPIFLAMGGDLTALRNKLTYRYPLL